MAAKASGDVAGSPPMEGVKLPRRCTSEGDIMVGLRGNSKDYVNVLAMDPPTELG